MKAAGRKTVPWKITIASSDLDGIGRPRGQGPPSGEWPVARSVFYRTNSISALNRGSSFRSR